MAPQSEKPETIKAARLREQAKEPEAPTKRHRGKSWEAVRSARKAFFNKISSKR